MKIKLFFISIPFLISFHLNGQAIALRHLDAVLVGPENVDRHHIAQLEYYKDYFAVISYELDIWLTEIRQEVKVIKDRNRRRIRKKKPIKRKDYPKLKSRLIFIKSLKTDQRQVEDYLKKWIDYFEEPRNASQKFLKKRDLNQCYDLITDKLVLSPKEYEIGVYEPDAGYFEWTEFVPITALPNRPTRLLQLPSEYPTASNCPDNFQVYGKSCSKTIRIQTTAAVIPSLTIINLLSDLPVTLEGWKVISCR